MYRRAFSLIEVGVAVIVLTVAIFGALLALGGSAQLRLNSAETEIASSILRARMAAVRSSTTDMGQIVNQEGSFVLPPRLKNGSGVVRVLTEAEASALFRTDINRDGTVDGNDLFDLDGDGVPGEGPLTVPGDTASGSMKTAYSQLAPVQIVLSWESVAGKTRQLSAATFIYPSVQ